ncbi:hypothetical protein PB2503_02157 [Parvularcula bermudensis HTCC2503]|uniref:SURF1-like protein n=1 Tax=Parvularcula bermudensis (strain ATCC BAA-594 / HTCC2503 / KCTC 12087) TaxID=314260 RepID=E0TC77_PARBH|nr:SURF1 family protein [Parvularcula bermudensis]ADM08510.1 hypothetical protein PB2503_02157 [Parvularcula bermudensis HTCC2503]
MTPWARPGLTAVVAVATFVLLGLGTWQLFRLDWKRELIATTATHQSAEPLPLSDILSLPVAEREWRSVTIEVERALPPIAHVIGTHEGQSGFFVFSLVELPNGGSLPVNHGFVAFADRQGDYDFSPPRRLVGLYRTAAPRQGLAQMLAPPDNAETGTFYGREPEGLIAYLFGGAVPPDPFYLSRLDDQLVSPLVAHRTRPAFSNNHLGYALTWFGLAAGLGVIYGLLLRRSPRA